jgi:hypothetical protein
VLDVLVHLFYARNSLCLAMAIDALTAPA